MRLKFQTPGGDMTWVAGLTIAACLGVIWFQRHTPGSVLFIYATALLIIGIALWLRQEWARWTAFALFFAGGILRLAILTQGDFTLRKSCWVIWAAWCCWVLWRGYEPLSCNIPKTASSSTSTAHPTECSYAMASHTADSRSPPWRKLESVCLDMRQKECEGIRAARLTSC